MDLEPSDFIPETTVSNLHIVRACIYDTLSTSRAAMMDPSDTKNDGRLFGNIVYEGIRPSITDDDFEPPQQVASPNSPPPPPPVSPIPHKQSPVPISR